MATTKRFQPRHGLDNNNLTLTGVAIPVNDTDAATKGFSKNADNIVAGTLALNRGGTGLTSYFGNGILLTNASSQIYEWIGGEKEVLIYEGSTPVTRLITADDISESPFKYPVTVATTGNINRSGTQTIDGVSLLLTDRVLVKSQTNASENGIYEVKSGSWTRVYDATSGYTIGCSRVSVQRGTVNKGKSFYTDFTYDLVVGTSPMNWYEEIHAGSPLHSYFGSTTTPSSIALPGQSASIGTSQKFARADHVHSFARLTESITTSSIGHLSEVNYDISSPNSFAIMKIVLSQAARLRLYGTSAARSIDASRPVDVDPDRDDGVILELITTGPETINVSPFVLAGNLDSTPGSLIYALIQNRSGSTTTISLDLTLLPFEA